MINNIITNTFLIVCIYLLQERYKNDLNIAIQLLQCKPSHFVSQKYDNVSKCKLLVIFMEQAY